MQEKQHSTLPQFKQVLDLDFISFYTNETQDIFIASIKELNTFDKEMAKTSLGAILTYTNGKPFYGITDASLSFVDYKVEALDYFRKHMKSSQIRLNALVVGDSATKIIATLYARFTKPEMPTRVFTNIESALSWIEKAKL